MRKHIFNLITKLTAIATIVASAFAFVPVRAASFTTMSDTMSRVKISTTAQHTITFDLPTGEDFDADATNDDVLTFTFPSGFTTGGTWQLADFTFVQDQGGGTPTSKTVHSVTQGNATQTPDCSGAAADTVAIAVETDTRVFKVQACDTTSYTASDAAATITFTIFGTTDTGTGTLANPGTAGTYTLALSHTDEGSAGDNTGSIHLSIVDDDQVTVTATVDPSMTFDIDTAETDTESAAPYTVALGSLTTGGVAVSGTTDSINHIWLDLDTNASGGAAVTVRNANGANGLVSTSTPADNINSAEGTMAAGTENYGLCVHSVAQTTGTLARAGDYTSPATCATNTETNTVEDLTSTDQNIVSTSGPVSGGRAGITVNAAISGTTPAHDDYTDTLTFVATGTF